MTQWNPIDSAPKDGTQLILKLKDRERVCLGSWIDTEDFAYGKSVRRRQAWTVDNWLFLAVRGDPEPTHWMHLPEPPL